MVKQGGTLKGVRTAVLTPTFNQNVFAQAAPVQNTWYPVCVLRNVSLLDAHFAVTVANETLEIEYTIDGTVFLRTHAAVAATDYPNGFQMDYTAVYMDAVATWWIGQCPVFARNLSVRIRKTTATGAGTLHHRLAYQQW